MAIETCWACGNYIDLDWADDVYVKMNGEETPLCPVCRDSLYLCVVCGAGDVGDPPDCPKNPAYCNINEGL